MRIAAVAAAALVLRAALTGCTRGSGGATTVHSVATFSCCESSDIDVVRHPGETFEVHWIMNMVPAGRADRPSRVVLDASLSGGYSDVSHLKSAEVRGHHVLAAARPVTTSSDATVAPVSEIVIPETAQPGLYDLITRIDTDGAVLSGASVIRVEAR